MKVFICGHGRHGKDEFAQLLSKYSGLSFVSSSLFVAKHVCMPYLERLGIRYDKIEDCYEDRHAHRQEWYDAIREYNREDKSRLSRAIFARYDVYVGIRDVEEFLASQHLADLSIWIDASERIQTLDPTCKITSDLCDIYVDNNGTLEDLEIRADCIAAILSVVA